MESPKTVSSQGLDKNTSAGHRASEVTRNHSPSVLIRWIASIVLLALLAAAGLGLARWKTQAKKQADAAAGNHPEPMEAITVAIAKDQQYRPTTISIGTVMALRSITLRNEVPGKVREVSLTPGEIVEEGTLLVQLDVSVEEAELKAQEAQAVLAKTLVGRMERAVQNRAASEMEADRARAELDVANAQIARLNAIIARKMIRAPFRARIGLSNVHPGQYLDEGTVLTTLQGVDSAAHVDFNVPQQIAQGLMPGEKVEIVAERGQPSVSADIVAVDARVDVATRNATLRAKVMNAERMPAPGASVRVRVPAGPSITAVSIPVSALRKGPAGDHVFLIVPDKKGKSRAQMKRVEIAAALGDEVLVASGISAGDQVAAFGSFKLREGALVAVTRTNEPAVQASR